MRLFKIASGILFIAFAYLQLNDPDSGLWIAIYSFAALACFMSIRELGPSWVFYALGAGYLAAAVLQWPPEFEGVFFGETAMRSLNIELARESLGLGICTIVMIVIGKWG
ncbi:transmembrane 220 family protein [Dyadobacter chenhuakuii]|uniref:Transmembrane 220 family protein n=1 Tax=Dyadobacter chenhuakuii TaxID=2909339 RepID=A0ABY4XTK9_9BACT|nr:transmembrane 220 family protein [Dyadobacter chenhuakuii]MCF2492237.1 transmembrane 220 family protein [Dyadobacter chenhuakuii]USJ33455.1 transmembrane 220 family protein [Dyadobacter chenhuakuii]